jgi:glucokinase
MAHCETLKQANVMTNYAIGLDVGGTKIAGAVVDGQTGTVLLRATVPTNAHQGGAAVLTTCVALGQQLAAQAVAQGISIAGVGLGLCELLDPTGRVTSAYHFDWRDLPVQQRLATVAPTQLETDVRAAALAEAHYGAGRDYRHFVYVTVGTGISSCLVLDGRPFAGARGNALVLASMPLSTTCPNCGTVLEQVLEEFASGPAIVRRYNAQSPTPVANGQELFAAVERGDAVALDVVQSAGVALGNSVAFLCNVLDPAAVIVGGGLGLAGGLYWAAFVAATRAHIYAEDTRQLPILPAALGVDAGVIGAAAVFFADQKESH